MSAVCLPPPTLRRRLRTLLLLLPLLVSTTARTATSGAEVLLVFDPEQPLSVLDAQGIRDALQELRSPYQDWPLSNQQPLTTAAVQPYSAIVLAHLRLPPEQRALIADWVADGGGLFASAAAAEGLESVLGITGLQPISRDDSSEMRFIRAHPVATGSYWQGPISQLPPMPVEQLPAVMQLLYLDPGWPAYSATPTTATILARWRRSGASWFSNDGSPALFSHQHGAGRTVYTGALAGAYADPAWRYPLAWRSVIGEALRWVNRRGSVVQLGYWPQAYRAAFALTADAERAAMATVVPELLAAFSRLGLPRFGTFFFVGQAGGDPLTEGAQEHPDTLAAVIAAGAEVGGHGDVHSRFAGQDLATQRDRLQRMIDVLQPTLAASGGQLLGFRAPGLAVDRNSFAAEVDVGLAYDSSQQDVWNETTLPYFDGGLWHLPVSSPMDYALLHEAALSGDEWELLQRDKLAYVQSRRGLFNMVIHPWLVADQLPRIEAMLADAMADGGLWLGRLDDLLYWWLQREDLQIEVDHADAQQLRLRVHNRGPLAVEGASLWLRPPAGSAERLASIDAEPAVIHSRHHGLGAEPDRFDIVVLPTLAAGAAVVVDWGRPRPPEVFSDGFENR